jgi:hypothetical protein
MEPTAMQALDRHALVVTIWVTAALIALTLFHYGLGAGGFIFTLAAFAAVIAAFIGHVIVNVALGSQFTERELALGLVLYAAALIAFGVEVIVSPAFAERAFLPASAGFLAVFAAFVFYLIVHSGVRRAFNAFDTIRSFSARDQLRHDAGEGEPS